MDRKVSPSGATGVDASGFVGICRVLWHPYTGSLWLLQRLRGSDIDIDYDIYIYIYICHGGNA